MVPECFTERYNEEGVQRVIYKMGNYIAERRDFN